MPRDAGIASACSSSSRNYFNGLIYYVGGSNDVGKTFSIANGQMSLTPTSQGPDSYAYPGSTPPISANGLTNGIVWAVDTGTNQLRAYNAATGFNTELYTSVQAAGNRDALTGSVVKFAVPTVADGLVFVGTSNALNVYGLLSQAPPPAAAPPEAPSNPPAPAPTTTAQSPLQAALALAIDTAAIFLQGNAGALLQLQFLSRTFLKQPLPTNLLSDLRAHIAPADGLAIPALIAGVQFAQQNM